MGEMTKAQVVPAPSIKRAKYWCINNRVFIHRRFLKKLGFLV